MPRVEHVPRARDDLHSRHAPVAVAGPILLPLRKAATGQQMGSVVQAAARKLAADAQPSVLALSG